MLKISIIIPIYNRKELLVRTLNSLLYQTSSNWECIMVDDGSTDGADLVAMDFAKKYDSFKFYRRNRNPKGAGTCKHMALHYMTGDYFMFLDSDDLLAPYCIENRLKYCYELSDVHVFIFNSVAFDNQGNYFYWNIDTAENDLTRMLRLDGVWNVSSPLYKQSIAQKFNYKLFPEPCFILEDWQFAMNLILNKVLYKKLLFLPPDVFIRRHQYVSLSQRGFGNSFYPLMRKFFIIQHIKNTVCQQYNFEVAKNAVVPQLEIVKEFLLLKNFKVVFKLLNRLIRERYINVADYFYFIIIYPFYMLRYKSKIFLYIYQFIKWLFKPFLTQLYIKPDIKILQIKYNPTHEIVAFISSLK